MKIGYFLSSEEWGPKDLIAQAVQAQEAGFEGLWISDAAAVTFALRLQPAEPAGLTRLSACRS